MWPRCSNWPKPTHRPAISWKTTWPPTARTSGNQITATAFDADSQTALVRLAWSGEVLGREGVLPDVGRRQPILLQGAFFGAAFTEVDSLVFAAFELSPVIHQWTAGARTATEIAVPAVRRRGVRPELFEEMLRDPSKAPVLVFDRSVPVLRCPWQAQ